MSFHGQAIGHLVRRGVSAAQEHFTGANAEYMQQLQHDSELYEAAGPEMEVNPMEMLPMLVTALVTLFIIASIRYTLGDVMASLTMIESPTSTAFIEDKPPAYADEPNAPLEKEPLMPSEAEADMDVEVTLIRNKPITASVRDTMAHLSSVGGFTSRWRGLRASFMYHGLHGLITNFVGELLGFGLMGNTLIYVFVSVALARFHMAWTHAMIATPSSKPFWSNMVARKESKAVIMPSLVFALAQQATWVLPVAVAYALGLDNIEQDHVVEAAHSKDCAMLGMMGLRVLAVPATAIFVAFAVLLPATVTLTRVEALLLPEDRETIVPFDRQALVGELDLTARGSSKALFFQAWRSFDSASRWRLIKVYVKMAALQLAVVFVSAHLMIAEMYVIGGERLGLLFKSGAAQIQLAAIEAQQEAN
ncbi:uncharacterized protein RCC_03288 [Ramularia collo-cygni]|uniref:Uncharacterized protein n=1 Tax=Ramularia collo-cygni TaxID=112498 RepID=A0A2D3V4N6_9PEZI|nr:uncharacterized protein RCC_03288 [Ramularia collo-cygni]CZT17454.1 uncharacterized protein RCC_03288 [Ramularia collo-cygni]